MKNSHKGFVVPLLFIITVLIIGGGIYYFSKHTSLTNITGVSVGLREINPRSINQSDPEYFKYQGEVYYSAPEFGSRGAPIVVSGADTDSFRYRGNGFGIDKSFVYSSGRKIDGSDGPTFVNNDPNYSFDKNQAYYGSGIIAGSDSASFVVIGTGTYAKDKNHVYLYGKSTPISDPSTFQFLENPYMKDNKFIYYSWHYTDSVKGEIYGVNRVDGADDGSFHALKDGFAQDKNNKYLNGKITSINLSALKSFTETPYSADDKNVYYNGKIITNADPVTFDVYDSYKSGNGYYASDKNHVYFEGSMIIAADPASFVIYGHYAKDNKYVFYIGIKIEGSDGSSFRYNGYEGGQDKNYTYSYGCVFKDNKQLSCVK